LEVARIIEKLKLVAVKTVSASKKKVHNYDERGESTQKGYVGAQRSCWLG
jgi:hypothetical protein